MHRDRVPRACAGARRLASGTERRDRSDSAEGDAESKARARNSGHFLQTWD